MKESIKNFIGKWPLMVVATIDVDGQKPESAVVSFIHTSELEIVFSTSIATRKYKNIQRNPRVSTVIGWDGAHGTVQYEGVARELSAEEAQEHAEKMAAKNPYTKRFIDNPEYRYFLITPTWIRFVDNTNNETNELQF